VLQDFFFQSTCSVVCSDSIVSDYFLKYFVRFAVINVSLRVLKYFIESPNINQLHNEFHFK